MNSSAPRAKIPSPGSITRRRLLAASAGAALALPLGRSAWAQAGVTDVDVAIVGGGAAGIAAARKIAESGRSYVLLEAGPKLGGRARTDTAFGQVFDLGAGSFGGGGGLTAAADAGKLPTADLPSGRRLFIDGREARAGRYDAFTAALGRARRDILAAADGGKDPAASTTLTTPDDWSATVAALLGPLSCGRGLAELSSLDLSLRHVPPDDTTSPIGVGAMLEALGAWLSTQTHAPVTAISNSGRTHTLSLAGQRGQIRARAVILAVPAAVIAAGAIRFNPPLPTRLVGAFRALPSGALEQVAFQLPGNPLALEPDESVLAKVSGNAVPALLRGRVNGSDLHVLTFGGAPAREIGEKGEEAALRLARGFLNTAFGRSHGEAVTEVACSRWTTDPLIRGALAAALPGQGAQRRLFAEPVQNRILLAGEYTVTNDWGTLNGAWESGEVAAEKALRLVGAGPA